MRGRGDGHGRGVCVAGGMHSGGHVWRGRAWGVVRGGGRAWHTVNERAVRILLECILVIKYLYM